MQGQGEVLAFDQMAEDRARKSWGQSLYMEKKGKATQGKQFKIV